MRSETIQLNGQPFFVRHWGDESLPKLLMLHGFPEYSGAWSDLAPHLTDRFHCIAPDQRGYGQSWSPDTVSDYALSNLVDDMAALIGDEPVTVFGHDWGAAVAYGLAMFRPNLVDRLIIANGVHPGPFQAALATGGAQSKASQYINFLRKDGSQDILSANDFEKLMAAFSANMDLSWMTPDRLATYKDAWRGQLKTMIHWYRATPLRVADPGQPLADPPALPHDQMMVNCPHLLIWGTNDTALLPISTQGLERYAPDLTRVDIAEADHWVLHQKPDQVARAVFDWINSVPPLT